MSGHPQDDAQIIPRVPRGARIDTARSLALLMTKALEESDPGAWAKLLCFPYGGPLGLSEGRGRPILDLEDTERSEQLPRMHRRLPHFGAHMRPPHDAADRVH